MDRVISTFVAEDLTGSEENDLLRGVAVVKTYEQLGGVSDILQFLKPTNRVSLFFPIGPTNQSGGHWIAIWFDPKTNTVHHFDSYGFGPEAEIQYSNNPDVRNQLLNRLYQQAQQRGINVVWNKVAYQKRGNNVNTCGRHVICRLRFSYLSEAQYEKLMLGQKLLPDQLVTMLTLLTLDEDQDVGKILNSLQ